MKFVSTRDKDAKKYSSHEVIINGIAPDGGLFCPESAVFFTKDELLALKEKSYAERAAAVISKYLTDYTEGELKYACEKAYSENKFPETPAPLKKAGDNVYMELFRGPTAAFKDVALQLMPRLFALSMEKTGKMSPNNPKTALILVATSGDTGKAALEGFSGVPGTKILVFYPEDGVSDIQKKQMLTQKGENVCVCGVKGNFDDCQTGVKTIFRNPAVKARLDEKGIFLSSANSINFGRLVPQVAYYFSACADMDLGEGQVCDVTVPSGNFGNILAAYMAKKAGAPLGKLICASNRNKVLTDFFNTGVYDTRREFFATASPSMDILVSSNLERLLWLLAGPEKTADYMDALRSKGVFAVDTEVAAGMREDFTAYFANEKECFETIRRTFEETGYLIDTHTAVGAFAAEKYKKETLSASSMLIAATASPFKFASPVCRALGVSCGEGFEAQERLCAYTRLPVPASLSRLKNEKDRFYKVISPANMADETLKFAFSV